MACFDFRILEKLERIIRKNGKYRVNIREYCKREGIFHVVNGQAVITMDDLQEVAELFDVPRVYAMI